MSRSLLLTDLRMLMAETVVGIVIIVVVLRDAMHELFHPTQSGSISRIGMRGIWWTTRRIARWRPSALNYAGPVILVAVVLIWMILLLLGWTLIYLPRLPREFNPNPGLPAHATHGFLTAVYVSLASMTTLAASDLGPKDPSMRFAVGVESFIGPVIFTAWVTWVLSIYPVLAFRRSCAHQIALQRKVHDDPDALVRGSPSAAVAELLRSFTEQIVTITAQLQQSSIAYYFQNDAAESTLARQLPFLFALACAAEEQGELATAIAHHGRVLHIALDQYLAYIGREYLNMHDVPSQEVLDALARDQMLDRGAERHRPGSGNEVVPADD